MPCFPSPLTLQPLIDEALVGGVLVDDDDAVARLRHNIGLVDLRARCAKRGVAVGDGRLRLVRAGVKRHVAKPAKRGLRWLGEAAS